MARNLFEILFIFFCFKKNGEKTKQNKIWRGGSDFFGTGWLGRISLTRGSGVGPIFSPSFFCFEKIEGKKLGEGVRFI